MNVAPDASSGVGRNARDENRRRRPKSQSKNALLPRSKFLDRGNNPQRASVYNSEKPDDDNLECPLTRMHKK